MWLPHLLLQPVQIAVNLLSSILDKSGSEKNLKAFPAPQNFPISFRVWYRMCRVDSLELLASMEQPTQLTIHLRVMLVGIIIAINSFPQFVIG